MVVVPFELVSREKQAAQGKQAAKARRVQALIEAQTMLFAALGRLGRVEGERGESSPEGAVHLEEEVGKRARPYVPNWTQVTTESNLSPAYEKMEWLLNCLPPTVLDGYNMLGAGSMIGLDVQSTLLRSEPNAPLLLFFLRGEGVISAIQA